MSELRSVIAFFLGLVFFIVLIGLAIGRIRLPKRTVTTTVTELVTPTLVPTIAPTKKPGFWDKVAGIFRRATPTPTLVLTTTPVVKTETPLSEMKEALEPGQITGGRVIVTKGGEVIAVDQTQTQSIPDTGAPTLFLPLSLLLGGFGLKLRRRS